MDKSSLTKFYVAAVLLFGWATVQGAIQGQKPVQDFLDKGDARIMVGGHAHIGTLGWVSLALMGTLYYLVPLLSEKQLSWPRMVNWIFWIEAILIPVVGALMLAAGIKSGMSYDDGLRGTALDDAITPLMLPVGILSIICGITALLFVAQILHTATKK
ncbi:MAG: cbb3-type cytochrome c oxidase subunit I [Actinomycetota bacterium]